MPSSVIQNQSVLKSIRDAFIRDTKINPWQNRNPSQQRQLRNAPKITLHFRLLLLHPKSFPTNKKLLVDLTFLKLRP